MVVQCCCKVVAFSVARHAPKVVQRCRKLVVQLRVQIDSAKDHRLDDIPKGVVLIVRRQRLLIRPGEISIADAPAGHGIGNAGVAEPVLAQIEHDMAYLRVCCQLNELACPRARGCGDQVAGPQLAGADGTANGDSFTAGCSTESGSGLLCCCGLEQAMWHETRYRHSVPWHDTVPAPCSARSPIGEDLHYHNQAHPHTPTRVSRRDRSYSRLKPS